MTEHEFDAVDRVAVGAFGEPGQRLFVLQARQGDQVLTVKVEKGQVAELATHITRAMADRPEVELGPTASLARLDDEAEPAWAVGAMRLGYDPALEQLDLVLEEFPALDEPGDEGHIGEAASPSTVSITMSVNQALALAIEITELVVSGRPPCPHCGYPLDPSGHVCPKSNGHRPPKL